MDVCVGLHPAFETRRRYICPLSISVYVWHCIREDWQIITYDINLILCVGLCDLEIAFWEVASKKPTRNGRIIWLQSLISNTSCFIELLVGLFETPFRIHWRVDIIMMRIGWEIEGRQGWYYEVDVYYAVFREADKRSVCWVHLALTIQLDCLECFVVDINQCDYAKYGKVKSYINREIPKMMNTMIGFTFIGF